jgi:hypothetical protein
VRTEMQTDHRTPLERYRGDSQAALLACSLKLCVAAASGVQRKAPGKAGDWRSGIVDGQRQGRANLQAALCALTWPAARDALMRHHEAFVTALKGMRPERGEAVDAYQARQYANGAAVEAAWSGFEVAHAAAQAAPCAC